MFYFASNLSWRDQLRLHRMRAHTQTHIHARSHVHTYRRIHAYTHSSSTPDTRALSSFVSFPFLFLILRLCLTLTWRDSRRRYNTIYVSPLSSFPPPPPSGTTPLRSLARQQHYLYSPSFVVRTRRALKRVSFLYTYVSRTLLCDQKNKFYRVRALYWL